MEGREEEKQLMHANKFRLLCACHAIVGHYVSYNRLEC